MMIMNPMIETVLHHRYSADNIEKLRYDLREEGTFKFPMLPTGLYPAAHLGSKGAHTGYHNVWVRDNVHIAHAHWATGDRKAAELTIEALLRFFSRSRARFIGIISGRANCDDPMNRPHVRFHGTTLEELDEDWSHAQNDALGYALWFVCKMIDSGSYKASQEEWQTLSRLVSYLNAIAFWNDRDSGHWEEERKVEASSIGVVVAGLSQLRSLLEKLGKPLCDEAGEVSLIMLDEMIERGRAELNRILPNECIEPGRERAYDAALLFLVYPLAIVEPDTADVIVRNVERFLKGDYGIRRYLLDSFWCKDYDVNIPDRVKTANFSENMSQRDSLVRLGEEAQWCVFDPILSVIYGLRYLKSKVPDDRDRQTYYFNRSLAQLTGPGSEFEPLRCPELYYCSTAKGGRYVPNDVTPLLWTQANLLLAFSQMRKTAEAG